MSPAPRSQPRSRDAAKAIDDFEWPPSTDDLSVYEMGPDPWQPRKDAPRQVPAARQRERSQPPLKPTAERAPQLKEKLAGVLAVSAIVVAAAGCVLYGTMTRPVPVRAIHHPAPPVAATPPPPPITIVATYPVEPAPSNEAPASHEPAPGGVTAPASPPADTSEPQRVTLDATPVDAPVNEQTASGPSEIAPPSGEPAAVDPGTNTPDPGPIGP